MAVIEQAGSGRGSRFWLYAPFALLALVAVAWTAAWFVIRGRTAEALDAFVAREAEQGRAWACTDRRVAGFPFRIEVTCSDLAVARGASRVSVGPIHTVAQVYNPRHIITEVAGPLKAVDGPVTVDATWKLLQASIQTRPGGIGRVSMVVTGGSLAARGVAPDPVTVASESLEAHLRPDPARFEAEGAYDLALRSGRTASPALDALLGGPEPADIDLDGLVTQAAAFLGGGGPEAAERWRQAGGRAEVERLQLVKGSRRIEGRGEFALDDLRRPVARLDLQAAGMEALIASLTGGRSGAADAVLGMLGGRRDSAAAPKDPKLRALPPLRIENGRVLLGPLPIPGVRIGPLY